MYVVTSFFLVKRSLCFKYKLIFISIEHHLHVACPLVDSLCINNIEGMKNFQGWSPTWTLAIW